MLNFYYERICHLRIAQGLIKDINLLNSTLINYSRKKAISNISYIALKYQKELDKIAIYLSGRPVIIGQEEVLYHDHTEENLLADIEYLIECLIIIGAAKYGVVSSIEDAIENLYK